MCIILVVGRHLCIFLKLIPLVCISIQNVKCSCMSFLPLLEYHWYINANIGLWWVGTPLNVFFSIKYTNTFIKEFDPYVDARGKKLLNRTCIWSEEDSEGTDAVHKRQLKCLLTGNSRIGATDGYHLHLNIFHKSNHKRGKNWQYSDKVKMAEVKRSDPFPEEHKLHW